MRSPGKTTRTLWLALAAFVCASVAASAMEHAFTLEGRSYLLKLPDSMASVRHLDEGNGEMIFFGEDDPEGVSVVVSHGDPAELSRYREAIGPAVTTKVGKATAEAQNIGIAPTVLQRRSTITTDKLSFFGNHVYRDYRPEHFVLDVFVRCWNCDDRRKVIADELARDIGTQLGKP